ncbi:hypothetical protein L2E82_03418 [Cichorium intybus]|uniref:Uncharacterized protein n=1 Tax=Cichorium intybus TaxID=13427 RepID=A0ACB9H4Q6_CICIN|nr:hypothetical protein L2E82_03418 [Cichorium intybus]
MDPCDLGFQHGIPAIKFPCRYSRIAGLCNGILCLTDDKNRITLWNPSIRHKLTLPDCPQRYSSRVVTGFGFDPITNNYKIVSISHPYSYIYSMKTGTWCAITSTPTPLFSNVLPNPCFVNGSLHWAVQHYSTKPDYVDLSCIMTFDLSTNVFGMIALPELGWETARLTTIQGSLAVLSTKLDDYWMWVRRDGSWFVVFRLNRKQIWGGKERVLQPTVIGDMLLFKDPYVYNVFHVYNLKTMARSKLVEFNDACSLVGVEMCVESLHLLDTATIYEGNQPSFLEGKRGEITEVH